MKKTKKRGTLLILLGCAIPIALWGLATGYHPSLGFLGSIQRMEIVLQEGEYSPPSYGFAGFWWKDHIAISYSYPLAVGIVLIFLGVGLLVLPRMNSASPHAAADSPKLSGSQLEVVPSDQHILSIVCPSCKESYTLPINRIPPQGGTARCRKCDAVFPINRTPDLEINA